MWAWLTRLVEPHPSIRGADARRQARLLSSFLLAFTLLIQITVLVAPRFVADHVHWSHDPIFVVGQSVVVPFVIAYALSRSRRVRWAADLLVGVSVLAPWFVVLWPGPNPYAEASFVFLLFATLFASLFWRAWGTTAVAVIQFGGALVVGPPAEADIGVYVSILIVLGVFPPLLVLSSHLRQAALRQVEAQAGDLERLLDEVRFSQQRYQMLADSTTEGIAVHRGGTVLEANRAFDTLFGFPPGGAIGKGVADLVAPESMAQVQQQIARGGAYSSELHLRRADGITFLAEVTSDDIPYRGGSARVVAVRDITERKRQEEARRVAFEREREIEQLRQVNSFKTHLLNTASHELNTPITPIKLQLHLLKETSQNLTASQLRSLEVLDRNLDRLAGLVQQVLEVARLQSDRLVLHLEPVDLESLVATVARDYPDTQVNNRLQVEAGLGSALLQADRMRLSQVLYNFLSNAGKYAPVGPLALRTRRVDGQARVELEDGGLGFAADLQGRLFEPFSQLHALPGVQGTGLGLYICRGIIEAHGGRIGASSAGPGRGSMFWFELPLPP